MSLHRKTKNRIKRRENRVRNVFKTSELPRVSIFRSLNHIYAQIIDMNAGTTIASCSSVELKELKAAKKKLQNLSV